MGDYQEQIATVSKERQKLEEALTGLLRTIGEFAYANAASLSVDPEDPALAAVRDAEEQLSGIEGRLSQLAAIERRQAGLKQEIANARSRVQAIEEEMGPLYQEIGRSAFSVYQDNPFIDPAYAELFQELQREVAALEEVEQELGEEERDIEEKPFLDRMLARGKVTWLKTRKQSREHSLEKHFRKVGKKIVETDFADVVEDPGLNAATRPYENQRQRIETLKEQVRTLEADLEHHREDLREGEASESSPTSLERQKADLEANLAEAQRNLGKRFLRAVKKDAVPDAIKEEAEAARRLDREIAGKVRDEKRLYQALRRKELEKKAEALDRQIRNLRGQAADLEEERERVTEEIAELEGRP
jgi:polyhydroxyalkanoate synthesis regulator phasin/uncharacterized protein YukE